MVFLVQPLIAYVNGSQEINNPVTKTMQDVCSSPDNTGMSCFPGRHHDANALQYPKKKRKFKLSLISNRYKFHLRRLKGDLKVHLRDVKKFSWKELKIATNNFSANNMIGEGGFSFVYKGKLSDGRIVAVKRSRKTFPGTGLSPFERELLVSSITKHRSLIPLYGYYVSFKERLLVYPFMANGDLKKHIKRGSLDWIKRKKIALGVARSLSHLHEFCYTSIIHRDVKPGNILLKENFEPVIADFGLARPSRYPPSLDCSETWSTEFFDFNCVDGEDTDFATEVAGTCGYIAPEYIMTKELSVKADVYAFGVTILQLISGKDSLYNLFYRGDAERFSLVEWTRNYLGNEEKMKIVDSKLHGDYVDEEMNQMIKVGLMCICNSPRNRPRMSEVVRMLEGTVAAPEWDSIRQELDCNENSTYYSSLEEAASENDEFESIYQSGNEDFE